MTIRGLGICLACVLIPGGASAQTTFKTGSLIIPMDTSYQDSGMLKAYGLLYALLKAEVPVHWVIKAKKALGDADLTATSKDFKSGGASFSHGYRGGPFLVESADAAKATPIVTAWQSANPTVTVHVVQADAMGRTARLLTAAPTIAVIGDGNEDIAFKYMNAAGIPDRLGAIWSKTSPDVLTIAEVAGPTTTKHDDGALFRPSGQPNFCQIMTMHWGVNQVVAEVVAEYRAFLQFPVHMMAECQAVNAIENHPNGRFITTTGFLIDNNVKDTGPFEYLNLDTPFTQFDGTYNLVGGSERAYSLPVGGKYHDQNVVMIKDATTTLGQRSVWMTGYIDGKCTVTGDLPVCFAGVGKVSYLGGHQYEVALPISTHPDTQGTRLFLNSLFEAGCATAEGQPKISLYKVGPTWTGSDTVTYTLSYQNLGPGPALEVMISDPLPAGASYVSSTGGGTVSGGTVSWKLGDVGAGGGGSVQVTVKLAAYGSYQNSATAVFLVGLNTKQVSSNAVTTVYSASAPDAGVSDAASPDAALSDLALPDAGPTEAGPSDGAVEDAKSDGQPKSDGAGNGDGSKPTDSRPGEPAPIADGMAASDRQAGFELGARRDGGTRDGSGLGSSDDGCNCALSGEPGPWSAPLFLALVALAWTTRRRRA